MMWLEGPRSGYITALMTFYEDSPARLTSFPSITIARPREGIYHLPPIERSAQILGDRAPVGPRDGVACNFLLPYRWIQQRSQMAGMVLKGVRKGWDLRPVGLGVAPVPF